MILSKAQKDKFAEKIMDLGNLIFIGLVIAQFVPGTNQIKINVLVLGVVILGMAYTIAYLIMKGVKLQ